MITLPGNLHTIVHIGAGRGDELSEYLASDAQRIVLIEPDPGMAEALRHLVQQDRRVEVLEVAITDNKDLKQLTVYNLPEANSLYQPVAVRQLFPGLKVISQVSVSSHNIEDFLRIVSPGEECNLLIIQAPGAEHAIINDLIDQDALEFFPYIHLTASQNPLYNGSAGAEQLLSLLRKRGYNSQPIPGADPDWSQWMLERDPATQEIKALKLEKKALNRRVLQVASELDETNQSIQRAESQILHLQEQVRHLEDRLSGEVSRQKEFADLKRDMEYLFGQQRLQLEQATNALGRHVTSTADISAKELEAGIALRQQYGPDLPSLEAHGTRLPATVALQLSHQLKTEPYDLIVEMGSGVTTSFMTHTLRSHIVNGSGNGRGSENTQVSHYIDPREDDLPKRIVCFEHNRTTYNEVKGALKKSGLTSLINLQFSPLVPCIHQGQEYLFYNCASCLQQIAKLFEERHARIFILVNQPGGDTQPNPVAAMPQVLQHLAAHRLDVVIDAKEHGHVVTQWRMLLEARGLQYTTLNEFGSGQVQRFTVNP